ncbi:MAG: SDR family oxidoreductase [Crocinitomicaceae bacterium]|nr:MAG: SDR family oxidoreductase [Crocinitomicaceae bacterium]
MKTTLIIGSSSAIGQATARKLIANGERVLSISRSTPAFDFDQHEEFDVLSEQPFPTFEGKIDGLVYCPGSILLKPFRGLKSEDFRAGFELNVMGAIRSIQAYTANLQLSDQAAIVLYSTVAVEIGMPFHAAVSVNKGAIEGLTKALAAEFASKIRVNCIAPSLTQTPMADKLVSTAEKIDAMAQRHPMKRIGQPEDIANATQFLLSDASSWMTGQIMHVDGGMSTLKA